MNAGGIRRKEAGSSTSNPMNTERLARTPALARLRPARLTDMTTNSNLPRAVREAEELAERLQQELINGPQGDTPPADVPPTDEPSAPVPPVPAPAPAPAVPEDTWEHRYKVLRGKYDAEVPRLTAQVRDTNEALQQLRQELDELRSKTPAEPLLRPEEIAEYGEGLIDVVRRAAREEVASKDAEIAQLRRQLENVTKVTTASVEGTFFRDLTALVPDWEQLNTNDQFLDWLDQEEGISGRTRMQLLAEAQANKDAARAAKFFKGFKELQATWAATTTTQLQEQIIPAPGGNPPPPPAKKIWTRPEIKTFYERVRKGEIPDDQVVAIEADITAATVEGRIR